VVRYIFPGSTEIFSWQQWIVDILHARIRITEVQSSTFQLRKREAGRNSDGGIIGKIGSLTGSNVDKIIENFQKILNALDDIGSDTKIDRWRILLK